MIPTYSVPLRQELTALLTQDGATVADYVGGLGITGTLNASAWANQIGAAPSLAQATGGNQPIVLPFTGAKYAYLPAVASNTFTTPNQSITGSWTQTFDIALNDYTPAADVTLLDKSSGNNGFIVKWLTTDKIRLVIGDGVGLTNVDCVAASSFTDGTKHTFTIAWADGVGATFSYDGVVSGSQVAAVKTLTNAAVAFTLGSATSIGKLYSWTHTGAVSLNFSAADWSETSTNGATQASSTTGETWTLNNTGALPAQIVASASLLFDGIAQFMKTAPFTLNQPCTFYGVINQVTWTDNDTLWDGNAGNTTRLTQTTGGASPQISLSAAAVNSDLPVNAYGVVTAIYNGASSSLRVNSGTATTGNPGAANPGGFILGAFDSTPSVPGNVQVKEVIIRNVADSAATQAQIQALLKAIYGTP